MSSTKTTNLNLNTWAPTDFVTRTEFNTNFDTIDAEIVKLASSTVDGRMSIADKSKLDGVTANAQPNQNAWTTIKSDATSITSGVQSDTFSLASGTLVNLVPDVPGKKITVNVTATTPGGSGTGNANKLAQTDANGRVGDSLAVGGQTLVNLDSRYAAAGHVGATGNAHGVATGSAHGFMSSTDKSKLDTIAGSAEVNQFAFSNVIVQTSAGAQKGSTVASELKTDTLNLKEGTSVIMVADSTTDTVTVSVDITAAGGVEPSKVALTDANGRVGAAKTADTVGTFSAQDLQVLAFMGL